jgi:hypothetical protein
LKIEQSLRARANLNKGVPISAARAHQFSHNQMVTGIHCAHVDFLVREDDDDSVLDVNGHLLFGVYGARGECLDLSKKRFATPGGGVARIDVDRDEVSFMAHEHLAFVGAPLRAECCRR